MTDFYNAKLYNFFKYDLYDSYYLYNKIDETNDINYSGKTLISKRKNQMTIWTLKTYKRGIPDDITHLTLGISASTINEKITIPDTIIELTLLNTDMLKNIIIPTTVKELSILFVTSVNYSIPKHITKLTLDQIETNLQPNFLPEGLTKLIFKKGYAYRFSDNILPSSLNKLIFGVHYWGDLPELLNLKIVFGCETIVYNLCNKLIQILGNIDENVLYIYFNNECTTIKCIREYYSGFFYNYLDVLELVEYYLEKQPLGKIIFEDLMKYIYHPRHLIKLSKLHINDNDFINAIEEYLLN